MKVDAHTLDNFVFEQVMEFLGSIVSVARRGLTDLSLQKIIERAHSLNTTLSAEKVSFQAGNRQFNRMAGWELTKCCDDELRYIKKCIQEYSTNSNSAKQELDSDKRIYNDVDEYEKDILRIRNERVLKSEPIIFHNEISSFAERMTIDEKKRVLEHVVAPEYGGKCVIRWAMPSDASEGRERLPSKKIDRHSSGEFRNELQIIEITFYADLRRIQALIWGATIDTLSKALD
jgi:hypothetical protein